MTGFAWTDHACRTCGAVLGRAEPAAPGAKPVFKCGTCRAECEGEPDGICGCGFQPGRLKGGKGAARWRCTPNPSPSPQNPAAIVILYGAPAA